MADRNRFCPWIFYDRGGLAVFVQRSIEEVTQDTLEAVSSAPCGVACSTLSL